MSNITVKMEVLEGKIAHFKSISSRISRIENKLSSIRRSIDGDVKYKQNIDGGLRQLCREIGDLEQDIYKAGNIVHQAIKAYEDVEKQLKNSFNELNRESKSNISNIVNEVPYYIGMKVTHTFKRIWSIFNEIQTTLTSSIDHLKNFFDEKGIIKRAEPTIHEEPIIDLEEDINISIPPLSGILSKNINIYNEDVKTMQQRLNELGYTDANGKPLAEDGYFGDKTLEAVNKFKEDNQLWNFGEYAGKVGETTWEYLFIKAKPAVKEIEEKESIPVESYNNREGGNPSYQEIVNYIVEYCNKIGLPSDIGLAIAWTESRMTQFSNNETTIQNQNKNKDGVVISTDWGIMQLNDKAWGNKYDFERISTDWQFNIRCGLDVALGRYQKAISLNEPDIPRATYSGYNTWSNIDRYRTENDSRDKHFYDFYQNKPWEKYLDDEELNSFNTKIKQNEDYSMEDTTSWHPVTPLYVYESGARTPEAYNQLIDQFNVASNDRYKPKGKTTYCNIFAWDVSIAMGIELTRFVEINEKGNLEDATGKALGRNLPRGYVLYQDEKNATATELNANRLAIWLDAQGENHGWKEITPEEAQRRANLGYMTISVIDESPYTGHVQVIRPTPDGSDYNSEKGVYLAQAGGSSAISNGVYFLEHYENKESYYNRYKFYTHD